MNFGNRIREYAHIGPGIIAVFFLLVQVLVITEHYALVSCLERNKCQFVEGFVTEFTPFFESKNKKESFQVNGKQFAYDESSRGFNTAAVFGGPLHEGVFVRLYFLENDILKIEIPTLPEKISR
ncbi:MAG: hypothetical protein HYV28_08150 [Ignavibacteriales bacterium]|nr:hypothetical protein [Ignavibacteriales bacterium]